MKYSTRLRVNVGSPIYLKEEKKRKKGNERDEERRGGKRARGSRSIWLAFFEKVGLTIRERDVTYFNPFFSR